MSTTPTSHRQHISYSEGGSSLTIKGTLANTGSVRDRRRHIFGADAATTVTLGGLTNSASTDTFVLDGSSSFAATLAFTGPGFTSNGGNFELTYAAPLTLEQPLQQHRHVRNPQQHIASPSMAGSPTAGRWTSTATYHRRLFRRAAAA